MEKEMWTTGRRKTSIARIKLILSGTGKIMVNNKSLEDYFGKCERYKTTVLQPLKFCPEGTKYDIFINVNGGGLTGQSESIRLGISRAICKLDISLRPKLKDAGLLSRDSRVVERKKPGQPKARKKFQWTKR